MPAGFLKKCFFFHLYSICCVQAQISGCTIISLKAEGPFGPFGWFFSDQFSINFLQFTQKYGRVISIRTLQNAHSYAVRCNWVTKKDSAFLWVEFPAKVDSMIIILHDILLDGETHPYSLNRCNFMQFSSIFWTSRAELQGKSPRLQKLATGFFYKMRMCTKDAMLDDLSLEVGENRWI